MPCIITIDFTLDIARKKFGMSYFKKMIHFFLQLIPIVDLIDGFYISIKYWNRGKVAAVVTAFCVIVGIAAYFIIPAL